MVYAILPDHSEKLWLSTNNGISRFDPHSETFRNYNMDNGLQSNEFNTGAYLKCEDGNLLFGGINGFNIIDPVEVRHNKQIPAIVITNFIKFDQALKFDQAVSEMGEIRLNYDENFITFEYSALDYTNPKKNQYAYKLEGLNQDWMYCGNRRYASYTNLDPGDYTFRVIGSNNDGVWNKQGASIRITITPPFWETGWFFATLSGVLLIALLTAHRYRVNRKIRQSVQMERIRYSEREKVREQVSKDYHDELGHKLTKILLFSELIKRNLNGSSEEVRTYLDKVILASESLSNNTRDFIWTLNPEKDNLYDLALYLREFGNSLFEGTDIGFQMKSLSEHLKSAKLPMEWKRHLTFIFKEGMNNILKHSQCQNVVLNFVLRNDELNIKLSADGSGFALTQQVKRNGAGNGLPNMKARAEKISGQIKINSDIGKGTTIMFRGQIPTNGYLKKT